METDNPNHSIQIHKQNVDPQLYDTFCAFFMRQIDLKAVPVNVPQNDSPAPVDAEVNDSE